MRTLRILLRSDPPPSMMPDPTAFLNSESGSSDPVGVQTQNTHGLWANEFRVVALIHSFISNGLDVLPTHVVGKQSFRGTIDKVGANEPRSSHRSFSFSSSFHLLNPR